MAPKKNSASPNQNLKTNKSEIHIFEGKNYEEWRIRFTTALTREGVRKALKSDELEKQYIELEDENEREAQMPEYATTQEIAQSILFDRLKDQHLRQVRKYTTVKQMLDHLDQKFRRRKLV